MFSRCRRRVLTHLAALMVLLGCAGFADAAWVTIRNDTKQAIVVQETIVVNGKPKRCRPINLLPGETLRESIPGPVTKQYEVFDAQNPNKSLWSGSLNCKDETQTFSVSGTAGKLIVTPVANPPPKK
jgi:hypothetical protein